jgi:phospholipid/cholesterol/gamma-HCH transport system permease protein
MPDNQENNKLTGRMQDFFLELAELSRFAWTSIMKMFQRPFERGELARLCYSFGNKSIGLIGITAFIMGLVLTVQTRPVLAKMGADIALPGIVFVSVIREIGPVITALIFAGKVGSGIGAELASMRVTEQIDAMEVSGTNPMKYLVATRVLATTLMVPALVILADGIALLGSIAGINIEGNMSAQMFIMEAFDDTRYIDFIPAVIKSVFFGLAIGVISCFKGYFATQGTQGVGRAANSAVVVSSLAIFIIDLIVVQITEVIIT